MKQTRSWFRPVLVLAVAVGASACIDSDPATPEAVLPVASSNVSSITEAIVPGEIIVRFRPGAAGQAAAAAQGASVQRAMRLPRTFVMNVAPGREHIVAQALSRNPNIEIAEPNHLQTFVPCDIGLCTDPSTFFGGRKWDLHNNGVIIANTTTNEVIATTGAVDADIDWLEAFHALGQDFAGSAVIGIIDSGIRASHGDLAGKVIAAQNFAAGYPPELIEDRDGHGTHVAGIAAASGRLAMHGVAWGDNISLINAKACELYIFPDGIVRTACPLSSTSDAIVWAVDQGANVLNLSLGGDPFAASGSAVQRAALQYARSQNVLPICATGNDGVGSIAFPARFPECVAVGSTTWSDTRASYSNFSADIELVAPGGDGGPGFPFNLIFSLSRNADNSYTYMGGTSMAAPQVAGLAGLLHATGVTGANALLARMRATADDLGAPGFDVEYGHGRINACRALDPAAPAVAMPAAFNRRSGGVFPVVIYGNERFDISLMDYADIRLGTATQSIGVSLRGGDFHASLNDVDGDGFIDIEVKFDRGALAAITSPATNTLLVTGNIGCRRLQGSQAVTVTN